MTEENVYHAEDMQLMGYGESDSSGAWLKMQVLPEDLEKFRGLKGAVFYVVMVKRQDSGEPEKPKGGPLSKNAGMLCQEKDFAKYARQHSVPGGIVPCKDPQNVTGEEVAIALIRNTCGIKSRAELDHNAEAAAKYELLKGQYFRWQRSHD